MINKSKKYLERPQWFQVTNSFVAFRITIVMIPTYNKTPNLPPILTRLVSAHGMFRPVICAFDYVQVKHFV